MLRHSSCFISHLRAFGTAILANSSSHFWKLMEKSNMKMIKSETIQRNNHQSSHSSGFFISIYRAVRYLIPVNVMRVQYQLFQFNCQWNNSCIWWALRTKFLSKKCLNCNFFLKFIYNKQLLRRDFPTPLSLHAICFLPLHNLVSQ